MFDKMEGKDIVIEVRVKWDDFMNNDQLHLLSMFSERAENVIRHKVVDELVKRIVKDLPTPKIDLSDLKERVKDRIVDRKVDEVLEQD